MIQFCLSFLFPAGRGEYFFCLPFFLTSSLRNVAAFIEYDIVLTETLKRLRLYHRKSSSLMSLCSAMGSSPAVITLV